MKRLLIHAFVTALCLSICRAAALLEWNTFGNTGTETTEASVTNDASVQPSSLVLGGGLSGNANANRFGAGGWFDNGNTVGGNSLAEAVTGNSFIEFTVTPNAGYELSLTSFVFNWDRSGTGPNTLTLRSSADNYVLNLGTVAGLAASLTTGNTLSIAGLSSFTTATTFRLYGYGASATAGAGGFDVATNIVNVQLNGTAVPEPTVASLLVLGVGFAGLRRRRR